jgi:predicted DCC family thiol-disulfide oxidoreductase YuxK
MDASKNEMLSKNIIFFDGVCHLCNSFIDHLITADKKRTLYYAPLQGTSAAQILSAQQTQQLSSIVYSRHGQILQESQAVLQILWDLGGVYRIFFVFNIVPRGIRDLVYRWVAKNRHTWFGQREVCRIPTPEQRSFLLP